MCQGGYLRIYNGQHPALSSAGGTIILFGLAAGPGVEIPDLRFELSQCPN